MSNFFSRLFGLGSPAPAPTSPQTAASSEFLPYLNAAQAAIERQQWAEATHAYQAGLNHAVQRDDARAQQFFTSGLGMVQYKLRRYAEAYPLFSEALRLAQLVDDPVLIARSHINIGELYAAQRQWAEAQKQHELALEMARSAQDNPTTILALENLARCYVEQNNAAYAVHLLKEAIALAQKIQDPRLGASVLGWLGRATIATGDRGSGRRYLEQAQRLAMQVGREQLALQWVTALANLDIQEEDYRNGIERYQAAETLSRRVSQLAPDFYMDLSLNLSKAYQQLGDYELARMQAERALMHAQQLEDQRAQGLAKAALGIALQGKGAHQSAQEHLQDALTYFDSGVLTDVTEQSRYLLALGKSRQRQKDITGAKDAFEKALQIARSTHHTLREAEALHLLGTVENALHNRAEAVKLWMQSIRLFENEGEPAAAARALCDLGNARRMNGDLNAATNDFENALMMLSNINDRVTRGLVLSNAANLYTQAGDVDTAEDFYKESIQIAQDLRDVHSESIRQGNLAWFYVQTGRAQQAIELFERSLTASRRLNDGLLVAIQTNNLGYAYARLGQHEKALSLYQEALNLINGLDAQRWQAVFQSNQGESLAAQGELEAALPLYESALQTSQEQDDRENLIRTRARLAGLYVKLGRREEAQTTADAAYQDARRMGYRKGQADAARVLGDLADNPDTARSFYAEAHKLYTIIHDPAVNEVKV